jgi:hypothetical protein
VDGGQVGRTDGGAKRMGIGWLAAARNEEASRRRSLTSPPRLDLSGVDGSLGLSSTSRVGGAAARWRRLELRQSWAAGAKVSLEGMRAVVPPRASVGEILQRGLPPSGPTLVAMASCAAVSAHRRGPSAAAGAGMPRSPTGQAACLPRLAVARRGPSGAARGKKILLRPSGLLRALCDRSSQPLSALLRAVVPQGVASRGGPRGALAAALHRGGRLSRGRLPARPLAVCAVLSQGRSTF